MKHCSQEPIKANSCCKKESNSWTMDSNNKRENCLLYFLYSPSTAVHLTHTHKLSHFTIKDISYASRECGCIVPHSSASGRSSFESTCKLTPYESTSSHLCHMLCLLIPPSAISCFVLSYLCFFKMTERIWFIYLDTYLKLKDLFCNSKLSLK